MDAVRSEDEPSRGDADEQPSGSHRTAVPYERAPQRERDKSLAREAFMWLDRLPRAIWPRRLGKQYPHVLNRLALLWPDPVLTMRYFESLLNDPDRPDRRGFSQPITEELRVLRNFYLGVEQVAASRHQARLLDTLRKVVKK